MLPVHDANVDNINVNTCQHHLFARTASALPAAACSLSLSLHSVPMAAAGLVNVVRTGHFPLPCVIAPHPTSLRAAVR